MARLNIRAIEKRLAAAKPGPWGVVGPQDDPNGVTFLHFISPLYDDDGAVTPSPSTSPEDFIAETLDIYEDDSTAQFLANSWQDITDLLAEVERLKKNIGREKARK